MIVDTSVIVAIILREPDYQRLLDVALHADQLAMSAGSWLELEAVVIRRNQPGQSEAAEQLLRDISIEIVPLTVAQAALGREGYRRFGRGTGHPAGLNFGDCFAYALAKDTGRPLLFKGDDFTHTDITPAV